jgi:hypothetical protein
MRGLLHLVGSPVDLLRLAGTNADDLDHVGRIARCAGLDHWLGLNRRHGALLHQINNNGQWGYSSQAELATIFGSSIPLALIMPHLG